MLSISRPAAGLALAVILLPWAALNASSTPGFGSEKHDAATYRISGKAHYALRDGLRIYLWEKDKAGSLCRMEGTL